MATGRVKWFNAKKGFGFLNDPETPGDIFVHYSEIRVDGFRTLHTDEEVEYELYHDDKGAKARNVVPLAPDARETGSGPADSATEDD